MLNNKETYKIGGMTCASCAKAVERVTKKLDGVEKSNINIATENIADSCCNTQNHYQPLIALTTFSIDALNSSSEEFSNIKSSLIFVGGLKF